ncbi:MAG: 23S rRNA (guanosine(2251)-2'-O)-methyltransferase RlmB [Candidatus Promineifilaceae bacterium]|nr:23S rRNA (guanosine(2251)-2'-O)-methyltransferase RlmB [Candidatus Promineifilaceae bacterium]
MTTEYLYRRNVVWEALRAHRRPLERLWLQQGGKQLEELAANARRQGLPVESTSKARLTQLAGDRSHQGVVLEAGPYAYSSVESMLARAAEQQEPPLLLLLDLLHGPQNIGTLLRTAEACGVHGIIIQDRRAPEITPQVVRYSAGAAEHLLIAQVTNLVRTMEDLKEADVWLVGLDLSPQAQPLGQIDLNMASGIVVGHEGRGMRRLVRERCDFLVRIPMRGQVDSLNAATAGAVLLYATWQARGFIGA